MKNELKPLAESVLISLGLTVASATNAAIQKKNFWIGYDYACNLKWRNEWCHENS